MKKKIINFFEELSAFLFLGVVICFSLQVIFRKVFNTPLTWSLELAGILYIWSALIGVIFIVPFAGHIRFKVAESFPLKVQRVVYFISLLVTGALLGYSIPPTLNLISYLKYDKTTVLHIPMDKIYYIYIVFLVVVSLRLIIAALRLIGKNWQNHMPYKEEFIDA